MQTCKTATNTLISHRPAETMEEATRRSATNKYIHSLRQVLRSQLNGQGKIQAINTYAPLVVGHPAGIMSQPKEREATDIKKSKLLTMNWC